MARDKVHDVVVEALEKDGLANSSRPAFNRIW